MTELQYGGRGAGKTAKTELQLQAKCFQWAWNEHPETRKLLFHVPNGGSRHAREAMSLKASGVVPGILDMPFLWKGRLHAFEFKIDRNGLSGDQQEVIECWTKHGATCYVIREFEAFKSIFQTIINKAS